MIVITRPYTNGNVGGRQISATLNTGVSVQLPRVAGSWALTTPITVIGQQNVQLRGNGKMTPHFTWNGGPYQVVVDLRGCRECVVEDVGLDFWKPALAGFRTCWHDGVSLNTANVFRRCRSNGTYYGSPQPRYGFLVDNGEGVGAYLADNVTPVGQSKEHANGELHTFDDCAVDFASQAGYATCFSQAHRCLFLHSFAGGCPIGFYFRGCGCQTLRDCGGSANDLDLYVGDGAGGFRLDVWNGEQSRQFLRYEAVNVQATMNTIRADGMHPFPTTGDVNVDRQKAIMYIKSRSQGVLKMSDALFGLFPDTPIDATKYMRFYSEGGRNLQFDGILIGRAPGYTAPVWEHQGHGFDGVWTFSGYQGTSADPAPAVFTPTLLP